MKKAINKAYYRIKPILPRSLQINLRKKVIKYQMLKTSGIWPILESAGNKPEKWIGWPDDKKFAFIITHDVETIYGHNKCRQLAKIETEMGFRSSYNFVPERYRVSSDLRTYLIDNGFEVGVHGLIHDGKLFQSEKIFNERYPKINGYIKDWGAKGFRAPAMHHNLEWIHRLNIDYDSSTFDTDPFEPQSDGVGTIFPFWVSSGSNENGYYELPYTLPQDFTLFILMNEKSPLIWKKKLDWIAEKGGMALMNVHPDYICFNDDNPGIEKYSIDIYLEFLDYIKATYKDIYYHDLPKNLVNMLKKKEVKNDSSFLHII